jgi:hypothetical protein
MMNKKNYQPGASSEKKKRKPRAPRQSVKEKKPRAPRARRGSRPTKKQNASTQLLNTNEPESAPTPKAPLAPMVVVEEDFGPKIATVLRDGVGFVADKLLKANGAIQKEFHSDQLLAELIHRDIKQFPNLLTNKAQIAV